MTDRNLNNLRFNGCRYVPATRSLVAPNGDEIRFRSKTRQVFEELASRPNELLTRDELVETVWQGVIVSDDTLNQSIREIRKALVDDDRKVLETISRQGYILHGQQSKPSDHADNVKRRVKPLYVALALVFVVPLITWNAGGFGVFRHSNEERSQFEQKVELQTVVQKGDSSENAAPLSRQNLVVAVGLKDDRKSKSANRLLNSVVSELSNYNNIDPTLNNSPDADYNLELSLLADNATSVNLHLFHVESASLVFGHSFQSQTPQAENIAMLASKVAAAIGSPAGGAIGQHLMSISQHKPVEELSRPECLAHGYGCTSCSGDLDSITTKATHCLANLLSVNPQDPDAWALQSTLYARQYFWGSALDEPLRSNQSERVHLRKLAVDSATTAETFSDGKNPGVYWGMAQAYLTNCNSDLLHESVNRSLSANPNDPALLGSLGNFLAFSGKWEEGVKLVQRAIELDPKHVKKWWYFALAKDQYRQGAYSDAYDYFLKGFDESNWLSHLQLTYTLPHLERYEDAENSLRKLQKMAPGLTLEHVLEFYKGYCFDENFLEKMRSALNRVGMPSRSAENSAGIDSPIGATVIELNDRKFEYIDVGTGSPIIFVHGSFSDYRTWAYMKNPVSEKNRFIAYTLKYFGTEPWPTETVSYDFYEDEKELIAFIEYLGIGPVTLVGWSRGVQPAAMVARSRPDIVSKLILYEGTFTGYEPDEWPEGKLTPQEAEQTKEMENAVEDGNYSKAVVPLFELALQYPPSSFERQPAALRRVVLDNAKTLSQLFANNVGAQPEFDCEFYSKVNTPTMVVHGEKSNQGWIFESVNIAECIPDAVLAVLENATHDGPISQPGKLSELINRFVNEHL